MRSQLSSIDKARWNFDEASGIRQYFSFCCYPAAALTLIAAGAHDGMVSSLYPKGNHKGNLGGGGWYSCLSIAANPLEAIVTQSKGCLAEHCTPVLLELPSQLSSQGWVKEFISAYSRSSRVEKWFLWMLENFLCIMAEIPLGRSIDLCSSLYSGMCVVYVPATWSVSYCGILDTACSTGQLFEI